jgi:hypothetical protein
MSHEAATYRRAWDGIEHFGTLDREILASWTYSERWTEDQRELKAEIDGERRQERQIAESTARLVARLVAARCGEG